MFSYNLIELHLIPKMLSSQNDNAHQRSSQFVTSIQVIPAKIVSVDCICAMGLSIKRKTFTYGEKVNLPFLLQYLVFFKDFFLNLEIILRPVYSVVSVL